MRSIVDIGTQIGAYSALGELGRGTASVVVRARAPGGPDVAIKLPLPGTADGADVRLRFLRGARAQQALDHPAIVEVLGTGEHERLGPYLVMQLVDGSSMGALLASGDLDGARALRVLAQVAAAIDHAHGRGIVHRDIKPSNVLVDGERAWLADFGLARESDAVDVTRSGGLVGTLHYLAPEVIRGAAPGPAADRYALAAMAYEALVGGPVFVRPTDAAVLFAHAEQDPPPPSSRRPVLPSAVDRVLLGALAKDPEIRPPSAAEFVTALREAAGSVRLPSPDAGRTPLPAADTIDTMTARSGWPRRRRATVAAGGAAMVAGALAVAAALNGDDSGPQAVPVPAPARGLTVVGSALGTQEGIASQDCLGAARASGGTPACTMLQRKLRGGRVVVPADGALRAWTVRGVKGEVALQVLRPRSGEIFQVVKGQPTPVPDTGPHRYPIELPVEAGDVLALNVSPEAIVGMRPATGARVERWVGPVGIERGPGELVGAFELQLRGEIEPGGTPVPPLQVTGAAARGLPVGIELDVSGARLPDGRGVRVALVDVGGRIHVDLFRRDVRRARIIVPDLDPRGRIVEFRALSVPDSDSQVNVVWRNPGVTSKTEHFYGLGAESLEFYS